MGNAGVDRAADSSPQAECPITRTNYIQTPTTDVIDAMEKFEELLKQAKEDKSGAPPKRPFDLD